MPLLATVAMPAYWRGLFMKQVVAHVPHAEVGQRVGRRCRVGVGRVQEREVDADAVAVHRLLGHRWLALVGRCSYSLYLWHVVPLLLLERAWLPVPTPVRGLLVVAATIALTAVSYRFLERPFLRSRNDVLRARALVRERDAAVGG